MHTGPMCSLQPKNHFCVKTGPRMSSGREQDGEGDKYSAVCGLGFCASGYCGG